MTKDEFIKLASKPWFVRIPSVYKVSIRVKGPGKAYEQNELGEWENDLLCIETHLFSNLANAEEFIRTECATHPRGVHSALVERLPLDQTEGDGELPIIWWLWDSKGRCVDRAVCSPYYCNTKTRYGKYMGRKPKQVRFKKGDIIEVIRYDRANDLHVGTLGIVIHTPTTIEEEWEYFDCCQKDEGEYPFNGIYPSMGYFHDYTDDQYGYLTGCYGDNALTCTVVQPTLPVPPEVEQYLHDYAASHDAWLRAMKNPALTPEELKEIQKRIHAKTQSSQS